MDSYSLEDRPKNQQQKQNKKFKIQTFKKILISNYGTLFDLMLYNNNREVICSGNDHEISFWDIESQKNTLILKGHHNTITKVAVCQQDPNILFSTSSDKTIRVWYLKEKEGQKQVESTYSFQNPDDKTTMGATFINQDRVVFGQCLNKAYFYNIKEQKIENEYHFDVENLRELKEVKKSEDYIFKDHTGIQQSENGDKVELQNVKQKQSWVTELGYMEKHGVLILCENSRLHFINPESGKVEQIFNNTHSGHILQMKIYQQYILLGSSDSYTYFYEFDKETYDLILRLKLRSHNSAIANVDFWFDQKQKNQEQQGFQNLPVGGIICSAFDPIAKFFDFKGEQVFKIDNIASPIVWDSEKNTIVGRGHNITREIVIQHFK